MTDSQTPASTAAPIAAVAVRLPPYWDRNPRVWFLQAESQFHLTHITSQQRMYHHVVSALSPTAADEVYDVLSNPSTTNPYDQLKAALLQRTEASERTRWQQLLSAEELGDRRPSQLLRRMTQLLGERASTIDGALLRELFLQRLPPNVQMVLAAATPLDLTGLAGLADAVMEVSTPSTSNIAATTIPPASDAPSTAQNVPIPNASQGYVDQLCQRLEQVVLAATSRRDSARSPSPCRLLESPGTSRRPENDRTGRDHSSGLCYYHRRFGPDARRCQRPCTWPENRPADR
ncbi:unnamed protein product [Ixodes pacificus]